MNNDWIGNIKFVILIFTILFGIFCIHHEFEDIKGSINRNSMFLENRMDLHLDYIASLLEEGKLKDKDDGK